jgi:hypothetical protein
MDRLQWLITWSRSPYLPSENVPQSEMFLSRSYEAKSGYVVDMFYPKLSVYQSEWTAPFFDIWNAPQLRTKHCRQSRCIRH